MADGITSFDVDDEFEGGVFGADGEFYAKSKKERKRLSKDEQIYGIFFDGADSPKAKSKKDTGFGSNTSFGAAPAAPKNYMNFVKSDKILYNPEAGKVKVNFGKKKKPATEAKPEAEEEGEPRKKAVKFNEDRNMEMIFDKKKPASAVPDFIESDDEAQEDEDQINIKISKKLQDRKQKFDLKKHNQESDILGVPNEFGKRRKPAMAPAARVKTSKEDIMEAEMEEKYGKGWKMMQKMDYKVNTGLGSKEQGRIDPIKAVKKTVLDGSKPPDIFDSGKPKGVADDLLDDLEDEDMGPRKVEQPKMWKKGKSHDQQKYLRRTAHVRAHDITVPEKEILKPVLQQKIIDMRGAEAKYYEDYTAMKTIEQPKQAATTTVSYAKPKFLSEMLLTVKGNVDKTKYNIQSFERKTKIEKDKVVNYHYEKKQRAEEQEKLDKNIQNLKILTLKLQQFKTQADTFNADETIQLFNDCFTATPEQFVYLKLDSLFIVTVIKKVQAEVSSWKITPDTLDANYDLYTRVKNFLIKILQYKEYLKYKSYTEKSVESIFKGTDNYDTTLLEKYLTELFNQTWTYPVKTYVINEWVPNKDLDTPLIPLFEKWKPILPPVVLTQMYDGVIMPKLQKAVDEWTPTSDPMPIHIWLHPWFPLLGQSRLETLWKSIQLKISQLLKNWKPDDKSAFMLLKPWLKVFDSSSWENLIIRCILPKVLYALTDFEINPKKQKIEPVRWMLDWADYIPQDTLVQTLENYVLRKIVEVGIQWLNTPGSKKEEIIGWLKGWKDVLGPKIMSMAAVQHYFRSLENIGGLRSSD